MSDGPLSIEILVVVVACFEALYKHHHDYSQWFRDFLIVILGSAKWRLISSRNLWNSLLCLTCYVSSSALYLPPLKNYNIIPHTVPKSRNHTSLYPSGYAYHFHSGFIGCRASAPKIVCMGWEPKAHFRAALHALSDRHWNLKMATFFDLSMLKRRITWSTQRMNPQIRQKLESFKCGFTRGK